MSATAHKKDLEAALAEHQQTAPEKVQLETETDEKDRDACRALDAACSCDGRQGFFGCLQLAQNA